MLTDAMGLYLPSRDMLSIPPAHPLTVLLTCRYSSNKNVTDVGKENILPGIAFPCQTVPPFCAYPIARAFLQHVQAYVTYRLIAGVVLGADSARLGFLP